MVNNTKYDNFVLDAMWQKTGGIYPLSVVDLFHALKTDPEYYTVLGRNIKDLTDRRAVSDYDYTVPMLKNALNRLRLKNNMSGAITAYQKPKLRYRHKSKR